MWGFLFGILSVVLVVDSQILPQIVPCHKSDAMCYKQSAQKLVPLLGAGIPALGMTPLDPLALKYVSSDEAGLKINFKNTIVKGLRNCAVLQLRRVSDKVNVELKCSVTLIGDYNINGKLLVLQVQGQGKYKIKIRDIIVRVQYNVGEKRVNGELYWTLDKWSYTSEVLTGAEFQFQNLFNGDKALSDTVHQFANNNWKDIFQEVAPPIVKAIVSRIVQEIRKLFSKVPVKELSLD